VVFDAVYDELYDSPPYAIDLDFEQSFFYVNSVSKTFGAPDLRVGWLCAPQDLRRVCHNILENQSIAVSTESQRHAQDILKNSTWQQRRELRLTLEHRGKQTQKLLRQVAGLEVSATGGPYGLVKLPRDIDVEVFCARLRESYDAAVLPGSYFRAPRNTFRIPLGMAPHAARRTVRVLKQAIVSIRIENFRSAISNLCESYSAEFLRLARSGILQILEQHSGAINRAQIDEMLGRDGERIFAKEDLNVLHRLQWIELRRQDAAIRLTSLGRVAVPYLYYYWLVRGAYGEILDRKEDGVRDLAEVGQASCQMSRFGAFPLLRDFLKEFGSADSMVLDVGCGTGEGTVQFVREAPGVRALGFDVCSESIQRAQEYAHSLGLTSVVSFQVADALDSLPREESPGTMVPTFSFVLHELVGQKGVAEVIRYLGQVRAQYPQSYVFVIEPDVRSRAEVSRAGPGAAAFYDFYWEKYYLIHSLTKQQLLPRAQWHEVFTAAGYKVVKERAIPTMVDPCELEIGYVLYPLRSHS
jgi:SAM-dependent methyltransferase